MFADCGLSIAFRTPGFKSHGRLNMKSLNVAFMVLVAVGMSACTIKVSDKSGIKGSGGGSGTLDVTGDVNKVSTFGGMDTTTAVYCQSNPRINFSEVRMEVKNSNSVSSKERLSFSFLSTNFPVGTSSVASSLNYDIGEDYYRSGASRHSCTATLSQSGSTLSGTVNCRGMVNSDNRKVVNISASFNCGIVTYN